MNYVLRSSNGGARAYAGAPERRPRPSGVRNSNARATLRALASDSSGALAENGPKGRKWETVEDMYRASHPRFLRIAYAILRDKEDAEDAVQDAALSACLHLRNFEGRSAFTTWFTRIVINAALMILRKRKSRFESLREAGTADEAPWAERIPALQPDPEMAYARQETFRLIDDVLGEMNPALREAFTLVHYEDFSMREASALLGVSFAAFKARLFRARKSLLNQAPSSVLLSLGREPHAPLSTGPHNFRTLAVRPDDVASAEIAFA